MVLFKSPATLASETDAAYFADQTVQRTFYVQPIVDLTFVEPIDQKLMFDASISASISARPIDAPIDASISAGIKPSAVSSVPQGDDTIGLLNTITPPVTADSSFSFRNILSTIATIISSGTTVVAAGESRDQLMKSIVEIQSALSTDGSITYKDKVDILIVLVVFLAALYERKQVSQPEQDQYEAAMNGIASGNLKTLLTKIIPEIQKYNTSTTAMNADSLSMTNTIAMAVVSAFITKA